MRRAGRLWERIVSWENLFLASREARRGKRDKRAVQDFEGRLEEQLCRLEHELRSGRYRPGQYHDFWIHEPKRRLISAASYRDRVVHHALCRVIEPIFDRRFHPGSFANRRGRGSSRAFEAFREGIRRHPWVLKADVRQYFPSIHHRTLKGKIRRVIKCRPTLELLERIVDSSPDRVPAPCLVRRGRHRDLPRHPRDRGIPIGNLTSQLFANVYLDRLDHELGRDSRVLTHVRYVDDLVCFGASRRDLQGVLDTIREHLAAIHLELHPTKTLLRRTREGAPFLGFFATPERVRVRSKNLARGRRRMRKQAELYRAGKLDRESIQASVRSWFAHLARADTWKLRRKLVEDFRARNGRAPR